MRYYKKCQDCNGQGKLAKRGSNYHLSISCPCEGGFVDCTSEVEAMRELLEETIARVNSVGVRGNDDFSILMGFVDRAKKLLAGIAKDESMKG